MGFQHRVNRYLRSGKGVARLPGQLPADARKGAHSIWAILRVFCGSIHSQGVENSLFGLPKSLHLIFSQIQMSNIKGLADAVADSLQSGE